MNTNLIKAYDDLDIKSKRNNLSNELSEIGSLLEQIEYKLGLDTKVDINHYSNDKMTEAETLTLFYQNIFNIERELRLINRIVDEDI